MPNLRQPQAISSKIKFSYKVMLATMLGLTVCGVAIAHETDHPSIEVHGDWVVTVSNPDGSIAQERSFKNALVTPGLLVGLIFTASEWVDVPDGEIWTNTGELDLPWFIEVATTGVDTNSCENYLSVRYSQIPNNSYERTAATASAITSSSFTLTRTLSLPLECVTGESYAINGVSTAFIAASASQGGVYLSDSRFTEKTLPAPITGILPDQVVTLKATISFQ